MAVVAVIEDEPDLLALIGAILTGHDTVILPDGAAALAYDGWGDVDVALVDLMMPAVSGIDVMIWLRHEHPSVRLVIVSALHPTAEVAGLADAVVAKPFTPAELLAAL